MYVEIFLLFLHHTRLHLILFLHPRCSCRGSCLAFDADACTTPAALPTTSPGGGAQEGPRRRLLCGLPLAAPCLAVAPARICAATWWRRLRGPPPAAPAWPLDGATSQGAGAPLRLAPLLPSTAMANHTNTTAMTNQHGGKSWHFIRLDLICDLVSIASSL